MANMLRLAVLLASVLSLAAGQDGAMFCSYANLLRRSDCSPVTDFRFTVIPNDLPSEVETIVMTGNEISVLYPGNFTYYQNLTTLYLNENSITAIPVGLASTVSSIENLYLDNNPITQIDDSAFQHFSNLKILSLNRTNLTTLRPNMFTGLTSIENLYFDESSLMTLPNYLFQQVTHVKTISIRNTNLQTLPDAVFSDLEPFFGSLKIYLANNPWSCDCNLQHLHSSLIANPTFPTDRDVFRCQWPTNSLIADLSFIDFQCSAPNITVGPQNASILTDRTYMLTCTVTGLPFPEVVWLKDGTALNYTGRLYLRLFDASLHFTNVELADAGTYQCLVTNGGGSDSSSEATLIVQESTCFDNVLSNHETDVDCGGVFCTQCLQTQRCKVDTDCTGELVCLYSHSLPSLLHYISPNHQMAYTCELPHLPRDLLNDRIQDVISVNIFNFNFTVETIIDDVQSNMATILAEQLKVPIAVISNVRVTTVERTSAQSTPLVQVWFNLSKSPDGRRGHTNLLEQIDNGQMKGTVKLIEYDSYYAIRLNL